MSHEPIDECPIVFHDHTLAIGNSGRDTVLMPQGFTLTLSTHKTEGGRAAPLPDQTFSIVGDIASTSDTRGAHQDDIEHLMPFSPLKKNMSNTLLEELKDRFSIEMPYADCERSPIPYVPELLVHVPAAQASQAVHDMKRVMDRFAQEYETLQESDRAVMLLETDPQHLKPSRHLAEQLADLLAHVTVTRREEAEVPGARNEMLHAILISISNQVDAPPAEAEAWLRRKRHKAALHEIMEDYRITSPSGEEVGGATFNAICSAVESVAVPARQR